MMPVVVGYFLILFLSLLNKPKTYTQVYYYQTMGNRTLENNVRCTTFITKCEFNIHSQYVGGKMCRLYP